MEHKELWLNAVPYNMTRVLNRLADMVEERSGTVNRNGLEKLIHTRGYVEHIRERQNQIEAGQFALRFDVAHDREKTENRIAELEKEKSELIQAEQDAPVVKTNFVGFSTGMAIYFDLDGFRYSFNCSSNPYLEDYCIKVPIVNDLEIQYCCDTVEAGSKHWMLDELFRPVADEETIEKSAAILLDYLVGRPESKRYEKERKRYSRWNKKGASK